jgi:hypothetical protein
MEPGSPSCSRVRSEAPLIESWLARPSGAWEYRIMTLMNVLPWPFLPRKLMTTAEAARVSGVTEGDASVGAPTR